MTQIAHVQTACYYVLYQTEHVQSANASSYDYFMFSASVCLCIRTYSGVGMCFWMGGLGKEAAQPPLMFVRAKRGHFLAK